MKKIISTILVCVLLVGTVFALSSCGMVFGKYKAGLTELEFGLGKVTITDSLEIGVSISKTYECKYKIEKGEDGRTITFTYEDGADKHPLLNGTLSYAEGDEDGEKYIKIGGIEYIKQ